MGLKVIEKEGWELHPSDKKVSQVVMALQNNNYECISKDNIFENKHCPCDAYLKHDICYCGLYVKNK